MKKNRIGIIGRVAPGVELFDGQTVSTRLWKNEIESRTGSDVYVVETYDYKHNSLKVFSQFVRCLLSCSHIVVILSGNGLKFFTPLLYYGNCIFHRKIFHRVIGGELDAFVSKYKKYVRYFNSFEVNWVQSNELVKKLEKQGVTNGEYLENFRNINPVSVEEIATQESQVPYSFFTFSRVAKSKGIGIAIEAVAEVNSRNNSIVAMLDVYGPVEEEYKEEFENLLKKYSDCVTYKGSIPTEKAVETIKHYYYHLFPTTWSGEGFPGTLIDCYNAGIPTIASNWAYNSEYIHDGITGYLYSWKNPKLLSDYIERVIREPKKTKEMRLNCLEEAGKYNSDNVMNKVMKRMDLC